MDQAAVTELVKNQVQSAQLDLLGKFDELISSKFMGFQKQISENQRVLSDAQISKIEEINSDSYKFHKKGNEEQYKANAKIHQKMREADALLKEDAEVDKATTEAQEKISQGIALLEYRQKLIKMADSSHMGWLTAEEYKMNSIADDSDDEKRIQRAENSAVRKQKLNTRKFTRGFRSQPYSDSNRPSSSSSYSNNNNNNNNSSGRKPGLCFACGKPGHWRYECFYIPQG